MIKTLFIIALAVLAIKLFVDIRQRGNGVRKNAKHKKLIGRKWFRVYYSGAYAWLEISVGRAGHHELVLLLGCTDRLVNWCHNKPH